MSYPIDSLTTQMEHFSHCSNVFPNSIICEVKILFINLKHMNNTNLRFCIEPLCTKPRVDPVTSFASHPQRYCTEI
ncbi:hypothetical protein glysoja_013885 [Glycine soja]|nr:hypothetical protein glysoja_013885 [Glycine soja]